MSDLISVVVPVYKVEKYLDRCVQSIVNQTYTNLEIILVDDGSPDRCPQMCDDWAKKDPRIKVIHQQNTGQGIARNAGIEQANGQYICFFDSDDYIEPDTIECAYTAAAEHDADMVCFGMLSEDRNGKITKETIPCPPQYVFSGKEEMEKFVIGASGSDPKTGENWKIPMSMWSKLISMRSVQKNNWRFVSERKIISEDFYSGTELYSYLDTVCIVPRALYHYCENTQSFSRVYRKDRFEKLCYYYEEIVKLCDACDYPQEVKRRLSATFTGGVISTLKQVVRSEMSLSEQLGAVKKMLDEPLLHQVVEFKRHEKVNWKQKLLYAGMYKKWTAFCWLLVKLQTMG